MKRLMTVPGESEIRIAGVTGGSEVDVFAVKRGVDGFLHAFGSDFSGTGAADGGNMTINPDYVAGGGARMERKCGRAVSGGTVVVIDTIAAHSVYVAVTCVLRHGFSCENRCCRTPDFGCFCLSAAKAEKSIVVTVMRIKETFSRRGFTIFRLFQYTGPVPAVPCIVLSGRSRSMANASVQYSCGLESGSNSAGGK